MNNSYSKFIAIGVFAGALLMACGTMPPATPLNFIATKSADAAINLTWDAAVNATSYGLERKLDTGTYAPIATPSATTYTDSALPAGSYSYRLRASNNAGDSASLESNVVTITAPVPTAPQNFSAVKLTSNSIALTWSATSTATSYGLERKSGAGAYAPIASPTAVSYTDSNLSNGSYTYRLTAFNAGDSSPKVESGVVTLTAPVTTVLKTDFESVLPAAIMPLTAMIEGVQGFAGLGTQPNTFSGGFLRSPTANVVRVSLTDLPAHVSISLGFLFAAIDSLDGTGAFPAGDFFNVKLDGVSIFRESFANATAAQIQSYVPADGVELARRVNLGFNADGFFLDSAYNMYLEPRFQNIPHTASTLELTFEIEGDGVQSLTDESWAMDNLEIKVYRLKD